MAYRENADSLPARIADIERKLRALFLLQSASSILTTPSSLLSSTDVQSALDELAALIGTSGGSTTVVAADTAAVDALTAALAAHIADLVGAHAASAISSVPAGTLAATDVQDALDELDTEKATTGSVSTVATDLANHLADPTDAHDASAISNVPAGTIAATDVQAALNELDTEKATTGSVSTVATDLSNHLADTVDAHDASAISNVPAGTLAATDVQGALNELDTEKATTGSVSTVATDLSNHLADTVDAHDASAISFTPVGTIAATDAQTAIAEVATDAAALYQPLDSDLTAIAALATTVFGRSLLTLADAAATMAALSGSATADFSLNSNKLTSVDDPTSAQDAATKAYVDNTLAGSYLYLWSNFR